MEDAFSVMKILFVSHFSAQLTMSINKIYVIKRKIEKNTYQLK